MEETIINVKFTKKLKKDELDYFAQLLIEAEGVFQCEVISVQDRKSFTDSELQELLNAIFIHGSMWYQKYIDVSPELTKKLCRLNNRSNENYLTH